MKYHLGFIHLDIYLCRFCQISRPRKQLWESKTVYCFNRHTNYREGSWKGFPVVRGPGQKFLMLGSGQVGSVTYEFGKFLPITLIFWSFGSKNTLVKGEPALINYRSRVCSAQVGSGPISRFQNLLTDISNHNFVKIVNS